MHKNLYDEIVKTLKENGKTTKDILWVGRKDDIECDPDLFLVLAKDYYYDDGFGEYALPADFYIVGSDWWLEVGEYDGATWWEFKQKPDRPDCTYLPESIDELF